MKLMLVNVSFLGLVISSLIGGFLYPLLIWFVDSNCNPGIHTILKAPLLPYFFVSVGCYFSFNKLGSWVVSVLCALSIIILIYFLIRCYSYGGVEQALGNDFSRFVIFVTIFGFTAGFMKARIIESQINPLPKRTNQDLYSDAKNYRMNPFIRPLGIIMGLLLTFFPLSLFMEKDGLSKLDFHLLSKPEVVMVYLLFSASSLTGVFFLAYCIPGKTPNLLLRYLKKKSEKES